VERPAFTDTTQIGIVVRDLEASIRRYEAGYGIGPWQVQEFHVGEAERFRQYGRPAEGAWRLATCMVGGVQWELIQPLDGDSVYARFLAEKGEGVHHIQVAARDFDATVADGDVIYDGTFPFGRVAYLGTERDLGVVVELFQRASPEG
jgi:methylmalonyl-CoA/ethylmalonyl-CoA epimerase